MKVIENILSLGLILFSSFAIARSDYNEESVIITESARLIAAGDYLSAYERIDKLIANEAIYNLHTCDYLLSRINSTFYQMPTDLLIPETKQKIATLNKNGPEILRRMQVFRENVKGKFFAFPGSTTVKETCANAVKRTLLYSRYTEEFLAEYLVNSGALSKQSKEILSNHESTIYRGSARLNGKHFIFKNGDVLLVRGIGMNSAMTSRIADEEQYFSHIAIVGKDLTGQLVVVESLKGGLQSTLITEYIKQKEARVSVLRHHDESIAGLAGDHAFKLYNDRMKSVGRTYPYDFKFDEVDKSEFFCSEVVQLAYQLATSNNLRLPDYRTTAKRLAASGFLTKVGVGFDSFFAPSDAELNKEFKLIADWRNTEVTATERLSDATFISMISWIIEKKYDISKQGLFSSLSRMIQKIREYGLFKSIVPPNITESALSTYLHLFLTDFVLAKQVGIIQTAIQKNTGFSFICKDAMAIAEKLRQIDCNMQETMGTSNYHWHFNREQLKCSEMINGQNNKNFDEMMSRLPETLRKALQSKINHVASLVEN